MSQEVSPRPRLHFFVKQIRIEEDKRYGPLHEIEPSGNWLRATLYQATATVSGFATPSLDISLTYEETDQIMRIVDAAARRQVLAMANALTWPK